MAMVETLYSSPGPLQYTKIPFNSPVVGAPVLFFLSGSGWSATSNAQIAVEMNLDGTDFSSANVFTNEGESHKSLVCFVQTTNLAYGSHTLVLEPSLALLSDENDVFTVTMVY